MIGDGSIALWHLFCFHVVYHLVRLYMVFRLFFGSILYIPLFVPAYLSFVFLVRVFCFLFYGLSLGVKGCPLSIETSPLDR
jgi:hypothetical protein